MVLCNSIDFLRKRERLLKDCSCSDTSPLLRDSTMDDGNSVTTKLLTLLNVSATRIGKRKRPQDDFVPSEKLNKRKSITFAKTPIEKPNEDAMDAEKDTAESSVDVAMDEQEEGADPGDEGTANILKCAPGLFSNCYLQKLYPPMMAMRVILVLTHLPYRKLSGILLKAGHGQAQE